MNATARPDDLLTTGDASRILNCSTDLVRHFERTGILAALRTVGGQRIFRRVDVERLRDRRLHQQHEVVGG